ncbi:hypothetical protein [Desulfofundulus australicus]|uniref:hypothetical protein n=1 Tax=Desulfofundulus australicus TaxID=1566 RepID=UPI0010422EC7|nr:hypothetical protein [Desulfofundulus australicus]
MRCNKLLGFYVAGAAPTDRYRLAEAIAGASDDPAWMLSWQCHHLLLLTATPHMGKDFPYFCLWRLLEPEILSTIDAFNAYPAEARRRHFLRRTKEEMVRFDGTPIATIANTAGPPSRICLPSACRTSSTRSR